MSLAADDPVPKMPVELDLQRVTTAGNLPVEIEFRQWIVLTLTSTGQTGAAAMTIRIVDAAESQGLNRDYRGKDYPTNVLAFRNQAPQELAGDLLGDLVICAPVVAREAAEQGKSLSAHWAHMTVHGTLHLLGFDHLTPGDAEVMEALERQLLLELGYTDPYGEGAP